MKKPINEKFISCDLCVVGGGLAGTFAAISAARHGASVVLLQDRPMLGGNASSEVRMWVRGAPGKFNRETGLISEYEETIIHGNPELNPFLTDALLYEMVLREPNIRLLLNTTCFDCEMDGASIRSIRAWQLTTYICFTVTAKLFADCSGDSILAPLSKAEYRHGREAAAEYGETLALPKEDSCTMGMSVLLAARETDHPVRFVPPEFANCYPDDAAFAGDALDNIHAQVRDHRIGTNLCNLWWVELGGEGDTIADADRVREELMRCIYGVWDHLKNHGDHGMENWELEWVGCLPGKRESRRYVGAHVLTEQEILSGGHFADEVAFGGWPLDDHNPYGMRKNPYSVTPSHMVPVKEPYGIPFRCLYSVNVPNLLFAGRNISVTHVALSSTRVMATCALLGQACGTAAAIAVSHQCLPADVSEFHIAELQRLLMDDGVFLPHLRRPVSGLTRMARLNLSDSARMALESGRERPEKGAENAHSVALCPGESLVYTFASPQLLGTLRIVLDPDYSRMSISENAKMRIFCMKLHTGKDFRPVQVAETLAKELAVYADGKEVFRVRDNFHALLKIPLQITARELRLELISTNGADSVKFFSVDFI